MRVLTGLQPSGIAHLGNLFGAMLPVIELAQKHEGTVVMLADLHSLTTIQDAAKLKEYTRELAIDLLALGLDPNKAIFFRQSDVPAHTELTWILSTITPMGLLQRAHSFKDKTAKGFEASAGLFTYPVLMTSDILLYSPDVVPVGKDQKQHLEMARDLAEKFNHIYGETFKLPQPQISEATGVIPGTDGQKMSKSYGNTIEIFASEKKLKKQIMGVVTDSTPVDEPKEPKGNNVFELYKLFAEKRQLDEMANRLRAGGYGYGDAKKALFEAANTFLKPLRENREILANSPEIVDKILEDGKQKAAEIADKKLAEVKKRVGL
jgi:tryptophanyl-tRNA synthetase